MTRMTRHGQVPTPDINRLKDEGGELSWAPPGKPALGAYVLGFGIHGSSHDCESRLGKWVTIGSNWVRTIASQTSRNKLEMLVRTIASSDDAGSHDCEQRCDDPMLWSRHLGDTALSWWKTLPLIPASPLYPPCCAVRKGLGGRRLYNHYQINSLYRHLPGSSFSS